jgi:hypothetical protein
MFGVRKRRIKCDEGRPACRKCVMTGFDCDGYSPGLGGDEDERVGVATKRETLPPAVCHVSRSSVTGEFYGILSAVTYLYKLQYGWCQD